MSTYLRVLGTEDMAEAPYTSSERLSRLTGFSAPQVRRDLACFGHFGRRGVGYPVKALRAEIRSILGIDRDWKVCVVGVGNLGNALMRYAGFEERGFKVVAAFDASPAKVGLTVGGVKVEPVAGLSRRVREEGVQLAIISVPAEAAQEVLDQLVAGGVRAVLNFARRTLAAPEDVVISSVDLAVEIEYLSYALAGRGVR